MSGLWACFCSGGQGESPLNYALLYTSGDEGESWKGPVLVVDAPGNIRVHGPNVWVGLSKDKGKSLHPLGCARAPEECVSHNEHMIVENLERTIYETFHKLTSTLTSAKPGSEERRLSKLSKK